MYVIHEVEFFLLMHLEDKGVTGESFSKGDRKTSQGIDQEVFPKRQGVGWGSPV